VTGGAIQRLETGGLCAYWEARGPYAAVQRTLERLGLTRAEAFSPANALSDQAGSPTVFEGAMSAVFPSGETMYDLAKHEDVVLPFPLRCRLKFRGTGVLVAGRFGGLFELQIIYDIDGGSGFQRSFELNGVGEFEFQLR
jgi:hypothetical protein